MYTIITWVNKGKYYAIILHFTPNVSHQEHFSQTISFVKMDSSPEVQQYKSIILPFYLLRKLLASN